METYITAPNVMSSGRDFGATSNSGITGAMAVMP
jgi:hypothetical protein